MPCRIRPMRPITGVHVHFEPDPLDLRVQMAVDSVRYRPGAAQAASSMGAITTKRDLGPDSCPERNTRETFAELAIELGFREKSSESGPLFIPSMPLTCEEG